MSLVDEAMEWADSQGNALAGYPAVVLAAEVRRLRAERDELRSVMGECGRKLDEALSNEEWGEVKSVWCDIDAILSRTEGGEVGG